MQNSTKQSATPPEGSAQTSTWDMANRQFYFTSRQCSCTQACHQKRIFDEIQFFIVPTASIPTRSWFIVNFSCFLNLKQCKAADSIKIRPFKPTQRDKCGLFRKVTIRGVSFSGRSDGIGVYNHKGTTLKEIKPTNEYGLYKAHYQVSRTFNTLKK